MLLVFAKLLEGVFKRFGLNSIIAYGIAGVIIGPATGLAEATVETEAVMSVGIFIFFFLIGLQELDIKGFLGAIRGRLFIASTISVLVCLLASLAVTSGTFYDFGLELDFTQALGLAGILSLSSLGVAARALIDRGRLRHPVGVQIFVAVIIAELLCLFIVAFTISEHFSEEAGGHPPDAMSVAVVIAQILAFTLATWLFSTRVLPKAIVRLHHLLQVPQLSFGVLLGCLFLVVEFAEVVGLHGTLGALLFGAALSTLPYQVRRDIMPGLRGAADGFFVPLFFTNAGLHLTMEFLHLPPETILALIVVPLVGKVAGSYLGAFITRLHAPWTTGTGLMAKGVAEIALLLMLLQNGSIHGGVFSLLVTVMFGYLLITPMWIGFALKRLERTEAAARPEGPLPPSIARFVLDDVQVSDLLDRSRTHPEQSLSVKAFVETWLLPEERDYVVVDKGKLAGIVSLGMLRYLPRNEWESATLGSVLRRDTPTAYGDEMVEDVLQRMTESALTVMPVADRETDELMGSISSHEVLEMLVLSQQGPDL